MARASQPSILLMGMRSSGKTTVGRRLAGRLDLPFLDLDERTLSRFAEQSVRAVFATQGEPAWRRAEREALDEALTGMQRQVIALGGGTPMIPAARSRLESLRAAHAACIVYLRLSAAEIQRRLKHDTGDRPGLTGNDPVGEIPQVLEEREPVFAALADLTIDCDRRSIDDIVESIVQALSARPITPPAETNRSPDAATGAPGSHHRGTSGSAAPDEA